MASMPIPQESFPKSAWAGLAAGAGVVVGAPLLCYANSLGAGLNVSLTSVGLSVVCAAFIPWKRVAAMPLGGSDIALAAFVFAALASLAQAYKTLAIVPAEYALHIASLLLLCPAAYALGRLFGYVGDAKLVHRLFLTTLILSICFLIARFAFPESILVDQDDKGSYYQYAGDSLAIAALLHYARAPRRVRPLEMLLVLAVLLLLGSRASFVAYAVALLVSSSGVWLVLSGCAIAVLISANLATVLDVVPALGEVSRIGATIVAILSGGAEDASLGERKDFLALAMHTIEKSPFLGSFGYDYSGNGNVGGFAHSAIDIWAQYGVIAFALFCGVVVWSPLARLLNQFAYSWPQKRAVATSESRRVTPLLVFFVCEFVLFRHPESFVLFFGLGAQVALSRRLDASESMR